MSIDLSQFHAVFFEESFEGLELMEAALLDLDVDNPDSEQINAIFRAAHSIKGGSGTFGFVQVSEFTHILETLLDKVRDGGHAIDADGIELFLQSVDCLRGLLEALQAEQEPDLQRANQLTGVFQAVLDGATYADSSSQVNTNPPQDKGINDVLEPELPVIPEAENLGAVRQQIGFKIDFKPTQTCLKVEMTQCACCVS